ncbi:probable N-acetyltransferase HLS1 isoform X2 [Ananas comosus]|uniref:Probable N-acetyltransferase HLS1 isoform X2 n=1 Tax=Ananas comosus TaxID=4615 RepID=A0A6P5G722_ANACO|nr:probable N-acetyltransferase HLS1 isoform X2 [Ananas comosus]
MKEEEVRVLVIIREYNPKTDCDAALAVDRMCEVGPSGEMSLFTDLLGDPVARIRHSPAYLMLVAETGGPGRQIVGLIRGCVKTVTCGKKKKKKEENSAAGTDTDADADAAMAPVYTKLGYLLGLRVSPSHRMGIGMKLVRKMEEWFGEEGAEYAYMATEKDNAASIELFTGRCGYTKFRTPSILVHPVFAHRLRIPRRVSIVRLHARDAEALYRKRFAATEFFPRDVDAILDNPLSLGTFVAVVEEEEGLGLGFRWRGAEEFVAAPPGSWAVASVWDCGGVFRLEVRGASRLRRAAAAASRAADRAAPWLGVPAVPDVFRPFAAWFVYGLGGDGPAAPAAAAALFRHAHNMARGRAAVVATEVAACEPLRRAIPHWRRLSCAEDLWCAKRLSQVPDDDDEDEEEEELGDWTKSAPAPSIFVDPREV